MDNQLYFPGLEPPHEKEQTVYAKILPALQEAAENAGGSGKAITIKHGKYYSSIWFESLLAFRICLRKDHYIEIPMDLKEKIPQLLVPAKQKKATGNFWRVYWSATDIVNNATALGEIVRATVDRTPKEWDCCSRYLECSNAKACVHPDKKAALVCGYRRILNTGKVFFGKNRNV